MFKKDEKVVTYKCPDCNSVWKVPEHEAYGCNIQLCKKCDRMVGLGRKNLIEAISYKEMKGDQ